MINDNYNTIRRIDTVSRDEKLPAETGCRAEKLPNEYDLFSQRISQLLRTCVSIRS